jgi:hypothetical protein
MDKRRYLQSLADELRLQENRVRDLISNSHWLSDGHHKEYLLAALIERYLPADFRLRRAFVVDASDGSCSKEIDLALIDDNRGLPIFDQGGLAVVLSQSVCAAITVKTSFKKETVEDAVANLLSVRRLAPGAALQSCPLWTGAFFYNLKTKQSSAAGLLADELRLLSGSHLDAEPPAVDVLVVAPDLFIRCGSSGKELTLRPFDAPGLAPALFLAALLQHLADWRGRPASGLGDLFSESDAKALDTLSLMPLDPQHGNDAAQ